MERVERSQPGMVWRQGIRSSFPNHLIIGLYSQVKTVSREWTH